MLRLVNWRKRLANVEDNRLRPGENIVATVVFQVRGAVARGAVVGGLRGARQGLAGSSAVIVPGAAIARATTVPGDVRYAAEGKVARLPVKPLVMALTDHDRVLVYSFVLGSLALTYETEYRGSDIRAIAVDRGFFARKATLEFRDGSQVALDLPRIHEYKAFCRRFRDSAVSRRSP